MNSDIFIKISDFVSLIAGWIVFYFVLKKIHADTSVKDYIRKSKANETYNEDEINKFRKYLHMQCICTTGGFMLITVLSKYFGIIAVLIGSVIYTFILVAMLKKLYPELHKIENSLKVNKN